MSQSEAVDPASVFLALATFRGDEAQAATALRLPVSTVRELAAKFNWSEKLKAYGVVPGSGKPSNKADAFGRQLNRSMNFIQAARLRELVDRLLLEMLTDPTKLAEWTTVVSKAGFKRDMRPVVDLVNAADTAQAMTARALQDTPDNAEKDSVALDGHELSLAIGKALDAANQSKTPSTLLVRQEFESLEKQAGELKDAAQSPQ